MLNPVTLIGIIVAAFIGNFRAGATRALEKLKERVSETVVNSMAEKAETHAKELADNIEKNFREVADQIISSISKEITDTDTQVKAVIHELQ